MNNEPTKIGITGVHGSGKTAKARELLEMYEDRGKTVKMVHASSLGIRLALGYDITHDLIFIDQYNREKQALCSGADVICCDGTVFDDFVYYLATFVEPTGVSSEIGARCCDLYIKVLQWSSTYDHLIRMPLCDPNADRFTRHVDGLYARYVQPYVTGEFE